MVSYYRLRDTLHRRPRFVAAPPLTCPYAQLRCRQRWQRRSARDARRRRSIGNGSGRTWRRPRRDLTSPRDRIGFAIACRQLHDVTGDATHRGAADFRRPDMRMLGVELLIVAGACCAISGRTRCRRGTCLYRLCPAGPLRHRIDGAARDAATSAESFPLGIAFPIPILVTCPAPVVPHRKTGRAAAALVVQRLPDFDPLMIRVGWNSFQGLNEASKISRQSIASYPARRLHRALRSREMSDELRTSIPRFNVVNNADKVLRTPRLLIPRAGEPKDPR